MNNPLKKLFHKKEQSRKVYLNNQVLTISPLTFEESLEVVFLILPYIRLVTFIRNKNNSNIPPDIFFDIIGNVINQLNRKDLNKAFQIILKKDEEFVSLLTNKDLVEILPAIITDNNFIEVFLLLRSLGAFN